MGMLEITIKIAKGKKAKFSDLFNRTDFFWKTVAITIILITGKKNNTPKNIDVSVISSIVKRFNRKGI